MIYNRYRLLVITNMYPEIDAPAKGVFVKNILTDLERSGLEIQLVKLVSGNSLYRKIINYTFFYYRIFSQLKLNQHIPVYIHYASHCALPVIIYTFLFQRKAPILVHTHGSDVLSEAGTSKFFAKIKHLLTYLLLKKSNGVVTPSSYFKDVLVETFRLPRNKIFISPSGGINADIFAPTFNSTGSIKPKIGFVSRLTMDKGVLDFIELFEKLSSEFPLAEAVVVGDGPLKNHLQRKCKNLKMTYFEYMSQEQLAELYNDLDLFIFPTKRRSESLGLVGLEALSCGCPVVAYDGTGPSYYITHNHNGFLVPQGDIQGLLCCIKTYLLMSGSEALQLKQNALTSVEEYSSLTVNANLVDYLKSFMLFEQNKS